MQIWDQRQKLETDGCEGCEAMMNRGDISFFCKRWLECQITDSSLLIIECTGLTHTLIAAVISPWHKCQRLIIFTYLGLFGIFHPVLISSRFLKKEKDGQTEMLTVNLTLSKCLLIEAESKRVYHESTVDMLREGEDVWAANTTVKADAFTPTSVYLVEWNLKVCSTF